MNSMILTNIQSSTYFKTNLYELKTYHAVIDEIFYRVSFPVKSVRDWNMFAPFAPLASASTNLCCWLFLLKGEPSGAVGEGQSQDARPHGHVRRRARRRRRWHRLHRLLLALQALHAQAHAQTGHRPHDPRRLALYSRPRLHVRAVHAESGGLVVLVRRVPRRRGSKSLGAQSSVFPWQRGHSLAFLSLPRSWT